jgi:8-oxo-dGTP pyrophosphatase MutT (NUDIX family)
MGYIDELRKLVGTRTLRGAGVRAVIRNEAGEILLQLRGDFKLWGLPAGGIELDESVWEALCREVHEETGLTVLRARPFGIYSNPKYGITYPNGDKVQPYATAFLVEEWSGTLVADGDESLDLQFFPLDAPPPPEQVVSSHRSVFQDVKRYLETGEFVVD